MTITGWDRRARMPRGQSIARHVDAAEQLRSLQTVKMRYSPTPTLLFFLHQASVFIDEN